MTGTYYGREGTSKAFDKCCLSPSDHLISKASCWPSLWRLSSMQRSQTCSATNRSQTLGYPLLCTRYSLLVLHFKRQSVNCSLPKAFAFLLSHLCLGLPYPTLPWLTLPYPTLLYPTLPYPTLPHLTLPYPTLPFRTFTFPSLSFPWPYLVTGFFVLGNIIPDHTGDHKGLDCLPKRTIKCVHLHRLRCV